jgi:hypothetical protein
MRYQSSEPHGHAIKRDPYFTLMADQYGDGFVHCGDGVLVVPLTDDARVLMAVERSPAFDHDVLWLVDGEVEEGEFPGTLAGLWCRGTRPGWRRGGGGRVPTR